MLLQYRHNCILNAVLTEELARALAEAVEPLLVARYGERVHGAMLYEYYAGDAFLSDGRMLYPLSVDLGTHVETAWISWSLAEGFPEGEPYGYRGDAPLDVRLEDTVRPEAEAAVRGRRTYPVSGALPILVETEGVPVRMLIGNLSQSFVDTMAAAVTALIEQREGVAGLAEAGLELHLVFARDTFMEHTSESTTYRRLILTDGGRTRRDLWVMWERLDGEGAFTVADSPDASDIRFALGEDVSQTVRQKEYRYLLKNENNNTEAYTRAMGRRNVSDWRELIKRAVKRGLLTVTRTKEVPTASDVAAAEASALADRLSAVMQSSADAPVQDAPCDDALSEALRRALSVADGTAEAAPDLASPFATDTVHGEAPFAELTQTDIDAFAAPLVTDAEVVDAPCAADDADAYPAPVEEEAVIVEAESVTPIALDLGSPFVTDTVHGDGRYTEPVYGEAVAEGVETCDPNTWAQDPTPTEHTPSDGLPLPAELAGEGDAPCDEAVYVPMTEAEHLALARERMEAERLAAEQAAREHAEQIARLTVEQQTREAECRRIAEQRQRAEDDAAREEAVRVAEEKERLRRMEEELLMREAGMRERITDDVNRAYAERERARLEEDARLAVAAETRRREQEVALEEERRRLEEAREALEAERARTAEVAERIRMAEEARLREEERLQQEQRLAEEARVREEERLREEAHRLEVARAEEQRLAALKAQAEEELRQANERHEAELRRLESERERIAAEERRLSELRATEEEEHRRRLAEQEEAYRQAALRRAEEEERRRVAAEQARAAEAARVRMQTEEQQLREQTQRELDEAAAQRTGGIRTDDEPNRPVYTFTSYLVKLHFERPVDPNIHGRLRSLIENTVQYFKKENVPISVRSALADGQAVNLHFYRIPREEYELLIHIVKVLGNSGLGIKKITLEEQRVAR